MKDYRLLSDGELLRGGECVRALGVSWSTLSGGAAGVGGAHGVRGGGVTDNNLAWKVKDRFLSGAGEEEGHEVESDLFGLRVRLDRSVDDAVGALVVDEGELLADRGVGDCAWLDSEHKSVDDDLVLDSTVDGVSNDDDIVLNVEKIDVAVVGVELEGVGEEGGIGLLVTEVEGDVNETGISGVVELDIVVVGGELALKGHVQHVFIK